MIRLTALWPRTNDSHFDMEYYLTKHVPLTKALLESAGLTVVLEVDQGLGSMTPGEPPAYAAIGTMLFETMEDLQNGLTAHAAEILADVPNFTDVQPVIQIGSVVLGAVQAAAPPEPTS